MLTKKDIIERKVFTEERLETLLENCKEWYSAYMDVKFNSASMPLHVLEKTARDRDSFKASIYEMLPYNVTAIFDNTGVYPDKINFCVFFYNGGEHYLMEEFRVDALTGTIIS